MWMNRTFYDTSGTRNLLRNRPVLQTTRPLVPCQVLGRPQILSRFSTLPKCKPRWQPEAATDIGQSVHA